MEWYFHGIASSQDLYWATWLLHLKLWCGVGMAAVLTAFYSVGVLAWPLLMTIRPEIVIQHRESEEEEEALHVRHAQSGRWWRRHFCCSGCMAGGA